MGFVGYVREHAVCMLAMTAAAVCAAAFSYDKGVKHGKYYARKSKKGAKLAPDQALGEVSEAVWRARKANKDDRKDVQKAEAKDDGGGGSGSGASTDADADAAWYRLLPSCVSFASVHAAGVAVRRAACLRQVDSVGRLC